MPVNKKRIIMKTKQEFTKMLNEILTMTLEEEDLLVDGVTAKEARQSIASALEDGVWLASLSARFGIPQRDPEDDRDETEEEKAFREAVEEAHTEYSK